MSGLYLTYVPTPVPRMEPWLHFMWPHNISELPEYEYLGPLPHLCTKNETMAPLHVATQTVKRDSPKYEIIFSI